MLLPSSPADPVLWVPAVLVLCCISSQSQATDVYFEEALKKLEQTMVRPAPEYEFVVSDTYRDWTTSLSDNPRFVCEESNVFVSGKRLAIRTKSFSKSNSCFISLAIYDGSNLWVSSTSAANRSGPIELSNGDRNRVIRIGRVDEYFHDLRSASDPRPDREAFQMLANPCFAPLAMTAMEIRLMPVTRLPTTSSAHLFEISKMNVRESVTVRFYFSPSNGGALVRTEEIVTPNDVSGVVRRTEREVESWQVLPNGSLVPSRFTAKKYRGDKMVAELVREIRFPIIGDVPDSTFTVKSPLLASAQFGDSIDNSMIATGKRTDRPLLLFVLVTIAFGIGLCVVLRRFAAAR